MVSEGSPCVKSPYHQVAGGQIKCSRPESSVQYLYTDCLKIFTKLLLLKENTNIIRVLVINDEAISLKLHQMSVKV